MTRVKLTKYIACVCEGAAEQAIIDLLLDSNKLIFDRSQLLDGMILGCRSGRSLYERDFPKELPYCVFWIREGSASNSARHMSTRWMLLT